VPTVPSSPAEAVEPPTGSSTPARTPSPDPVLRGWPSPASRVRGRRAAEWVVYPGSNSEPGSGAAGLAESAGVNSGAAAVGGGARGVGRRGAAAPGAAGAEDGRS
jgi:hypothetical protein